MLNIDNRSDIKFHLDGFLNILLKINFYEKEVSSCVLCSGHG